MSEEKLEKNTITFDHINIKKKEEKRLAIFASSHSYTNTAHSYILKKRPLSKHLKDSSNLLEIEKRL